MSSVIIKDMQIPSECRMCPLCRYFYSTGITNCMLMQTPLAEDYKTIRFEGRHKDCPLVELPEKHGRLIDADALIREHFSHEHRIALSEANKAWMRKIINDAPTIVESEGE